MSLQSSPASTRDVSIPTTMRPPDAPGFGDGWAAWEARGDAHDRAFRRKLAIATPVLAVITAVILYLLAIR